MTLIWLVLTIFAAVALMVVITERFGKPMSNEKMAKLSPIIIFLVFAVLIGQVIYHFVVR